MTEPQDIWDQATQREHPDAVTDKRGKLVTNSSATMKHNFYLSAPHSMHEDPAYFHWCADCRPKESEND